ncbi:hypothetical protein XELAEV_18035631mg [Xenopus laevis]|uniref:Uncharacterized protein n=1 Tax=Xenopus laevis TaxID=8355 RepID=A0A974HCB6_XENLA|nr:hypothetical protein XELAEV_18035631mg [Xenopus laevis]
MGGWWGGAFYLHKCKYAAVITSALYCVYLGVLHLYVNSNLPKSLFYITGTSKMGMSASSRLYYQWRYEKPSPWISPDLGIFEIRDFEDPLVGPYLECIRDKITYDIRFALYDLWMAKDCVKITKWWKLHLKNEFWQDYRYIKAHLKHLYKDLEKINKAILIKNNERYSDGPRNNSQTAHDSSTTSSFLGTKYRCTSV